MWVCDGCGAAAEVGEDVNSPNECAVTRVVQVATLNVLGKSPAQAFPKRGSASLCQHCSQAMERINWDGLAKEIARKLPDLKTPAGQWALWRSIKVEAAAPTVNSFLRPRREWSWRRFAKGLLIGGLLAGLGVGAWGLWRHGQDAGFRHGERRGYQSGFQMGRGLGFEDGKRAKLSVMMQGV